MQKISKNSQIKIKCHRGASTEDLLDYINPIIRKKPDLIIVHGGTNDITNNIDTAKNIDKIITAVKRKSPNTKIAISNLITRKDRPNVEKSVDEVNKKLETVCTQHNVDVIKHSNIKLNNLSPKKLHLNRGGSSLLVRNFTNYLNSL